MTFNQSIYANGQRSASLYTDKEGKIDLGNLDNIYQVYSHFTSAYGDCSRTWNIPHYKEVIDYPSNLEILEDEDIELPIPTNELTVRDISFTKYSNDGSTIKDCFENCKLDVQPGYGFGNLHISNLPKGQYTLEVKKLNIEIEITVHEGVYWEADGFIQKKNSIIEFKTEPKFLRISHVRVLDEEEKGAEAKSKLSFKLSNTNEDTRAHVFAFTYLSNQPMQGFKSMNQITKDYSSTEVFPFNLWENVYQSNRKLGDEYRYVFNRKNAKRFIGNTLEKPQLIMKRLKVRDTGFDNEVVRDGAAYAGVHAEKEYATGSKSRKMYTATTTSKGMYESNISRILYQIDQIYSFQNFLKHATLVRKNLHPDQDGYIECDIDSKNYSCV